MNKKFESYRVYSNTDLLYYLKHQKPIMHRQFLEKLFQNPDYVLTHCKDKNNTFLILRVRNESIK